MKAKECLKRGLKLAEIGIKKATSYKMVKGKLGNRFYSDEFLQDRIQFNRRSKEAANQ